MLNTHPNLLARLVLSFLSVASLGTAVPLYSGDIKGLASVRQYVGKPSYVSIKMEDDPYFKMPIGTFCRGKPDMLKGGSSDIDFWMVVLGRPNGDSANVGVVGRGFESWSGSTVIEGKIFHMGGNAVASAHMKMNKAVCPAYDPRDPPPRGPLSWEEAVALAITLNFDPPQRDPSIPASYDPDKCRGKHIPQGTICYGALYSLDLHPGLESTDAHWMVVLSDKDERGLVDVGVITQEPPAPLASGVEGVPYDLAGFKIAAARIEAVRFLTERPHPVPLRVPFSSQEVAQLTSALKYNALPVASDKYIFSNHPHSTITGLGVLFVVLVLLFLLRRLQEKKREQAMLDGEFDSAHVYYPAYLSTRLSRAPKTTTSMREISRSED